ncbi:Oligosaccharyl transferase-like protein, related [Neospora caninum Liverpool]|uniref:dolichyl-diphosphooligosaccharide--protein glycotransferase n=1 Tax=Neospora caninum (strain Liverpool) TaxID=572307 RepID=F0VI21_NEOCL|nr:Oligosaccharyl transferase-like protein, related [Neospora caninum Liverpool]CBZ53382.1 Oligosaccharyl transferase-like protein, related [Neospora caninum Liverpool]|eukprot:XP_003883414.1 Oligosaccharyl transferase-like protein, related [Neospora caninum Liverpool]
MAGHGSASGGPADASRRDVACGDEEEDQLFQLDYVLGGIFHSKAARKIQTVGRRWSPVVELAALLVIFVLCFCIRLFAVIRYESVIHEFDPYFNYRTTIYLAKEGFYEFWNWFDHETWYPLGRVVGQTLFPGLMSTSKLVYDLAHAVGFPVDIPSVCVFLAPFFSGLTAVATYCLTKQASGSAGAGLFAALFAGISPSYMSRSVAGSYDNEAVAIFAMVNAFFFWIRALNKGTMFSALLAAVATLYMVVTWGGYVFVINAIAVHMIALAVLGLVTARHVVVYNVFYVLMIIMCLNVPFVNFAAVSSSEHMACHGVFIMVNALAASWLLKGLLPAATIKSLLKGLVLGLVAVFLVLFVWLTATGRTSWSARSLTLLDPTYATKYLPIIASVSEHQPATWATYIFDLHIATLLAPLGLIVCFRKPTDGSLFAGIYGVLAAYFSGIMVRLMLVLSPAAAVLAGIGASRFVSSFMSYLRPPTAAKKFAIPVFRNMGRKVSERVAVPISFAAFVLLVFAWITTMGLICIGVPERCSDLNFLLRWDYGYQATAMGNRTVFVDNNTWNNTHIATVGLALSSNEEKAYKIMQALDVDYVFVVFGGVARYHSDDLNKFLWIIRITSGVYPAIQQSDFLSRRGMYTVSKDAPKALVDSLMYKLSYHRFADVTGGFDFARNVEVGHKNITLHYFEEAYTTENWLVRIYKVKRPESRHGLVRGGR